MLIATHRIKWEKWESVNTLDNKHVESYTVATLGFKPPDCKSQSLLTCNNVLQSPATVHETTINL